MPGPRIRVLLVDDHAILREAIRALFSGYEDIVLVGEAASGREAIEKTRETRPDVVLMDITMPDMDGLEATQRIHRELPNVKILVLTQHENAEYISSSVKVGASGYLPKRAVSADLISAVRALHHNGSYLYPSVAQKFIKDYLGRTDVRAAAGPQTQLTAREAEILKLVAEGRTSRQIAAQLGIAVKTVITHRTNIMRKLGVRNRAELVKYAIRKRIIDPNAP